MLVIYAGIIHANMRVVIVPEQIRQGTVPISLHGSVTVLKSHLMSAMVVKNSIPVRSPKHAIWQTERKGNMRIISVHHEPVST